MLDPVEILAYHGWGFSAACWQPYTQAFSQVHFPHIHWQIFDRGYFGTPHPVEFTEVNSRKIIVAHSYGLHHCPDSILVQAEVLILLNSFVDFHGDDRRRSQRKLQRMIQAFEEQPLTVWQTFMVNTFLPDPVPFLLEDPAIDGDPEGTEILTDFLLADLYHLQTLPRRSLPPIPHIYIYNSPVDYIVPQRITRTDRSLPSEIYLEEQVLSAGGHGFPFSQSALLLPKISALIP